MSENYVAMTKTMKDMAAKLKTLTQSIDALEPTSQTESHEFQKDLYTSFVKTIDLITDYDWEKWSRLRTEDNIAKIQNACNDFDSNLPTTIDDVLTDDKKLKPMNANDKLLAAYIP